MAFARARFTMKVVDRGWNAIKAAMREAKDGGSYAKVGLIGTSGEEVHPTEHGEQMTNAQLAAIHEYGTARIPQRSFIGSTFDLQRQALWNVLQQGIRGVYDGKLTVKQALGLAGLKLATEIKKRVTSGEGIPPPNAPSTLARKLAKGAWNSGGGGSPRTLIDTGRLINAVSWQVITGGGKASE